MENFIGEFEKKVLLKAFTDEVDKIEAAEKDLAVKKAMFLKRIADLSPYANPLAFKNTGYSADWTLAAKVRYILLEEVHILNTRELALYINRKEKNVHKSIDLVRSIGATLLQKVEKKVDFSRIELNGDLFYGLIEWFNEDGSVKQEFNRMYKEGVLEK